MTIVNIVVLDTVSPVPGVEWGLALGDAPTLDTAEARAFLKDNDAWDTTDTSLDTYPLIVLEEDWDSAALTGYPWMEVEIPAEEAAALAETIATEGE